MFAHCFRLQQINTNGVKRSGGFFKYIFISDLSLNLRVFTGDTTRLIFLNLHTFILHSLNILFYFQHVFPTQQFVVISSVAVEVFFFCLFECIMI